MVLSQQSQHTQTQLATQYVQMRQEQTGQKGADDTDPRCAISEPLAIIAAITIFIAFMAFMATMIADSNGKGSS